MGIKLIEIPQTDPGFNRFIGAWLITGRRTCLVDVGPAASAHRLTDALTALGVGHIDLILITHIHIDHGGGLAHVLARYPMARVVCHEKAASLLADPAKLWAGSLSSLGKTAEMYGMPVPVPEDRLVVHTRCEVPGLTVLETPGHAAHHLSFCLGDHLFAGEAGGNFMALPAGTYLRPATPHRFFMEAFLESLDRLRTLSNRTICYGHFGKAPNSAEMLDRFRAQLFRWREIILEVLDRGEENPVEGCLAALLEKDPELSLFHRMDPALQNRERFFLTNSINGFIGYLRACGAPKPPKAEI